MIASLLHACGLDLGPKKDFLPPASNNPAGFWESRSFLRLNDAILKERGGSWDHPPLDVAGSVAAGLSLRLHKQARMLIARFEGREPWGWKDPRNCLTLPLWRNLLPEMKVLVCVRNPLAVAESLWLRNGIPHADSFDLWLTYNRRVLDAAPAECRLITHCDSYLHDPGAELRRVLQWAGLFATEDQVDRACRCIAPSLMHHRMTMEDLADAGALSDLLRCYRDLCAEANTHIESIENHALPAS
jgi:hypothetical protein